MSGSVALRGKARETKSGRVDYLGWAKVVVSGGEPKCMTRFPDKVGVEKPWWQDIQTR